MFVQERERDRETTLRRLPVDEDGVRGQSLPPAPSGVAIPRSVSGAGSKGSIKESNAFVGGSRQLAYRLEVGVDEADAEASVGESRHPLLRRRTDRSRLWCLYSSKGTRK